MRSLVRALGVAAVALASVGLAADASCAPPAPLADRIARADAIVHGTVVAFEGGSPRALRVEVRRVYKGGAPALILVAAGPGAEVGGGAPPAATSVDYGAAVGTDHTLYLKQHAPTGFATNACEGSHPGPPTAEEAAALGEGRAPDSAAPGAAAATEAARWIATLALAGALILAAAAIGRARRRRA